MFEVAFPVRRHGRRVFSRRTPWVSLVCLALTAACSGPESSLFPGQNGVVAGTGGHASAGTTSTGGQASGGTSGATGGAAPQGGRVAAGGASAGGASGGGAGLGGLSSGGAGGTTASGGDAGVPPRPGPCQLTLTCERSIPDDPKVDCELKIDDAAGKSVYSGRAGVELRGRSSINYPKKNYAVELRNQAGEDNPAPMLGMGKEADWVFDGSWVDRSFMRNDLAFWVFQRMGHYAPESRYCDLKLNGKTQGVYRLVEKIKRDDDRLALSESNGSADTFLVTQETDGNIGFPVTENNNSWQSVYPKHDNLSDEQRSAMQRWLDEASKALYEGNAENPDGALAYLDAAVTTDFVLLEEFSKNIDAYNLSLSLFRNAGGKLGFVPWDFDLAFGQPTLRDKAGNESSEGWVANRTRLIRALIKVPGVTSRLGPRWRELRKGPLANAAVFAKFDELQEVLTASALTENFAAWPLKDVEFSQIYPPYSLYKVQSYDDEVTRLRSWLEARLSWLDAHIDEYPD